MTESPEPAAERRAAAAALDALLAAGCREIRLPQWLDYDLAREDLDRAGVTACKFVAPDGRVLMLLPDPTLGVLQALPLAGGGTARVCYWADAFRVIDGEWVRRPQVGAELLGYPSRQADPQVLLLALDAAAAAGCRRVRLVLNDAGLTDGLCGLLPPEAAGRARLALAAGDFVELERAAAGRSWLADALRYAGPAADLRRRLAAGRLPEPVASRLAHLEWLSDVVLRQRPDADILLDAGMVREIGYYDGLVFQLLEQGTGRVLAAGGRYDGLVGEDRRGAGFACDVVALAVAAGTGGDGR